MKLKWFLSLVLFGLLLSCDNDDYPNAHIPSVVINKFRTTYPEASEVRWVQVDENYQVDFESEGSDAKILLKASGEIIKEKQDISIDMLPGAVVDFLGEQFGKEKIEDPELIIAGDQKYYQVEISRFIFDKELVVNEQGVRLPSVSYWD